jgi:hypothetical protein
MCLLKVTPSPFRRVTQSVSGQLGWYLLLALIFFLPTDSQGQHGARTIARGLDQLTEEADVIVHGYVTSTRIEPHPQLRNLNTIVVSLEVKDTYKGKPTKSLTFRQYVWDPDPQRELAEYGKHQELILFLGPVSEYGLTSPVGLDQGRFRIYTDQKKQMVASNGRGNLGLFHSVVPRARAHGITLSPRTLQLAQQTQASPLLLRDLEEAIRTFVGAR